MPQSISLSGFAVGIFLVIYRARHFNLIILLSSNADIISGSILRPIDISLSKFQLKTISVAAMPICCLPVTMQLLSQMGPLPYFTLPTLSIADDEYRYFWPHQRNKAHVMSHISLSLMMIFSFLAVIILIFSSFFFGSAACHSLPLRFLYYSHHSGKDFVIIPDFSFWRILLLPL